MMNTLTDHKIAVLNIGTKILLKDVMDQYLRSFGRVKTYYASKFSVALEQYLKVFPRIIFCENHFPDGSAIDFIQSIGGLQASRNLYFVLCVEFDSPELLSLAMELGIDEVLVKPFSTEKVGEVYQHYLEKRENAENDWVQDLRKAHRANGEKKFFEAGELFGQIPLKHSHNFTALIETAEFFVNQGNLKSALPILEKLMLQTPENVSVIHLLGKLQKKMGKLPEAVKLFQKANSLSPLNTQRNLELAEAYWQLADEQVSVALNSAAENSNLILCRIRGMFARRDYLSLINYVDSKNSYLSEAAKKEAEVILSSARKIAGLK